MTSGAADEEMNLYKKYIEIVKKDKLKSEKIHALKLEIEQLKRIQKLKTMVLLMI